MTTAQAPGTLECSVCYEPTGIRLDCGGNHPLCVSCLQRVVAGLGEPVETGDEGPKGLLISYVNLPSGPLCRGRIHLAPHVADPLGLDNFPNNHPDPTQKPQYYYDDYEGLAPHEVQTFVFDAAEAAIAAVDNMESDDDDEDDAAEDDDDDDEEQQWRDYLTSVAYQLRLTNLPDVDPNVGDSVDDADAYAMSAWIVAANDFTTTMTNALGVTNVSQIAWPNVRALAEGVQDDLTAGLQDQGKVSKFIQAASQTEYNLDPAIYEAYNRIQHEWVG